MIERIKTGWCEECGDEDTVIRIPLSDGPSYFCEPCIMEAIRPLERALKLIREHKEGEKK